jgi:hypothetical protein
MRPTHRSKIALGAAAGLTTLGLSNRLSRFDRPVRCHAGHLFTTIWIPLGSLKAIRLGATRVQFCPVGHHWTRVVALDPGSAAPEDLAAAAAVHDVRIP